MRNIFLFMACLLSVSVFGSKPTKEIKGDKYFAQYSYALAIEKYTQVEELSIQGQRNLAKSYYHVGNHTKSEEAYAKLVSSENLTADDLYDYAFILGLNGKYDSSAEFMSKFLQEKPDDLRALNYMANVNQLDYLLSDQEKFEIISLNVNTEEQDFAPSYYEDKIVFASTRQGTKMVNRKYNWNGLSFLDLYVADINIQQLSNPRPFEKSFNGTMHEGVTSFSNNGKLMACTRNSYEGNSENGTVNLQIFFSEKDEDGNWKEETSFVWNNSEYSVGHPSLSSDGQILYFSSNIPNGYGGADLYKAERQSDGTWGNITNLGDRINTEADELFPFYLDESKTLYFSSTGHFGLGGLDIYITTLSEDGSYTVVENVGFPLNTNADDFGIIIQPESNTGYFSSNREGGKGNDDIYALNIKKPIGFINVIAGTITDLQGSALDSTLITLYDQQSQPIDSAYTSVDGKYRFQVKPDIRYTIRANKMDHFIQEKSVKTEMRTYRTTVDFMLEKYPEVGAQFTLIEINQINFDLDKFNIRPDAASELNKIVEIMNSYPDMIIELGAHTDDRGSDKYNEWLSSKRAISSVNYIKSRISNPERISGKGYGETMLLENTSTNDMSETESEKAHAINRRAEFMILSSGHKNVRQKK